MESFVTGEGDILLVYKNRRILQENVKRRRVSLKR
jgi:hypothetical protein